LFYFKMPKKDDVNWEDTIEDYQLSYVPGVDKCKESKYSIHKDNPAFIKRLKSFPPADGIRSYEKVSDKNKSSKGISLKDLCEDDKKRIAQLIQELANLQEEKENIDKKFQNERKAYEEQLRDLKIDKDEMIREKNLLHEKYDKCQEIILEYQEKIIQQQKAATEELKSLNESIKIKSNSSIRLSSDLDNSLQSRRVYCQNESRKAHKISDDKMDLSELSLQQDSASVDSFCGSFKDLGIDIGDGYQIKNLKNSHNTSTIRSNKRDCSMRRRQLAAQRAALEKEQHQLRKLLDEQEYILNQREHDLKMHQRSYVEHESSKRSPMPSIRTKFPQSCPKLTSNNLFDDLSVKRKQSTYHQALGSPRVHSTMMLAKDEDQISESLHPISNEISAIPQKLFGSQQIIPPEVKTFESDLIPIVENVSHKFYSTARTPDSKINTKNQTISCLPTAYCDNSMLKGEYRLPQKGNSVSNSVVDIVDVIDSCEERPFSSISSIKSQSVVPEANNFDDSQLIEEIFFI